MSRFTKRRGQQIQDDIEKSERQYRSRRVDEAIQRGYERVWDGEYAPLTILMRDILLEDLNVSRHTLRRHAREVRGHNADLQWDHEAVRRFVEDPNRYLETLTNTSPEDEREQADRMYLKAAGMKDPRERALEIVTDAFHSLESLAVARGFVSNSVTNFAPAFGYELQLGTWYQPPRDDMPYEIQLVDPGDSEEVTVNMGKPGRGKGVMGHTEAEDRYAARRKIVDAVDFDECEGGVLDIAMANPNLREVREEMGLPADFTEHPEYDPPNVEIMVPLTDGLADKHIPYYGDGPTDTVVQPFTVPASSLSKRALKRFIASELTSTQANIFESAYDQIQRRRDDWNLTDLIMAVENHRGLHGNQGAVDRVQRAIKRVQSKGWIRDEDDPHSISWERILTDPDTATIFTASLMPDTDEAAKYLFHSYVIFGLRTELKRLKQLPAQIKEERGWNHVPKLTVICRELHKIAPNSETSVDDPTIREIQEAITSDFRDLTAMHRHEGVEITADTQNFIGEIKKRARVNFNRACLFQVNRSPASAMFEEMAGENRDQYPNRVTRKFGVGECAVLGRVGTGRPFEMTVSVAPPMSHHFDPDEWVHTERGITKDSEELETELGGKPGVINPDGWTPVNSAWDLRVHLKGEEYRPAKELLDATKATDPDDVNLETVHADRDRPDEPAAQFAWDALGLNPDRKVTLDHLEMAYYAYAEQRGFTTEVDRSGLAQRVQAHGTPEDDDNTFGDVVEYRRPALHDHPDGKGQTPVYQGAFLKEPAKWLDCCENPEFSLTWDGEELDGWECEGCGAGPGNPGTDPDEWDPDRGGDGDDHTEDATEDGPTEGEDGEDTDDPEDPPEGGLETVSESMDMFTAPMDGGGEGEDVTEDGTATAPEDAMDPAREDVDCECSSPRPVPMYAGEERDEQVGMKCEGCGEKEWF